MKTYPIKNDRRYTITHEAEFVVRFRDELIGSSKFYTSAVVKAVAHKAQKQGAITL